MKRFIYLITTLICCACSSGLHGEPTYFYIEEIKTFFSFLYIIVFISEYIENLPNNINLHSWCGSSYSWSTTKLSASISIPISEQNIVFLRDPNNIVKCSSYQDFVARLPNLFPEQKDSTVDINLPLTAKDHTISYCIGEKRYTTKAIPIPSQEKVTPRIRIHEEIPDHLFQLDGRRDSLSVKISGADERLVKIGKDSIICHPIYMHDAFSTSKYYSVFYVNKEHPNVLFCDGSDFDSYCDSTIVVITPLNKILRKGNEINNDWIQYCP